MIRLCREAGLKDPVFESDQGVFSTTIYRNAQPGLSNQLSNQLSNLRNDILLAFSANPNLTIAKMAKQMGISETGINKNIAWLKDNHYLDREGNNRSGRWIVLNGNDPADKNPDPKS